MKAILGTLLALFHLNSNACEHGFFPQNNFHTETTFKELGDAQSQLTPVINIIEDLYKPVFAESNKTLTIDILWDQSNTNAYATRDMQDNPIIRITGGMMRNPHLNSDGMALILCHELGHFLGGEPKKLRGSSTKKSWSSAEGQADYYATAVCLKKYFKHPNQKSAFMGEEANRAQRVLKEIKQICKSPLCKRIASASMNVAEVYAQIDFYSQDLSLVEPDTNIVYYTVFGHPNPQCRLDTMVNGLLCPNSENLEFEPNDPLSSTCKSAQFRRPRCWYYPQVESSTSMWDF
jgi:hypothetical protein